MQLAFDYYNSVVQDSPFQNITVEATHYYIKINPSSLADLEMLDELDDDDNPDALTLQDYPMDYEILEEGDYFVMPKDKEDIYHSAYTLIPVGYHFPQCISYEVLEEIYEPTEDEYDVETVSLFFSGWEEDLEADDIFLTYENLDEYLTQEFGSKFANKASSKKFTPHGTIRIEDTDRTTNVMVPLQKEKISIGRNFFWKYTYTDDLGVFESPKKYRGKVRIRAKWRGKTATIRKTFNEILGLWVSDHLMTLKRSNNNAIKNIMYGEPHQGAFGIDLVGGHLWYKATIHNGLRKYNDFASANGINKIVSHANVWVWAKGNSASTPMLHKYRELPLISTLSNIGQANVWSVLFNSIAGVAINIVPPHLRPDFIFAGLKNKKEINGTRSNTVIIHSVVFHESGHYSHASKAGSGFWAQVFAAEMSNNFYHNGDSYRNGDQPSFTAGKRIGLAEGWGNLCEFKITSAIYGKAYMGAANGLAFYPTNSTNQTPGINALMEGFDIFDTPMTVTRFDDQHWFAHGVMWDCLDNNIDNNLSRHVAGNGNFINNIIDNCFIGNMMQPNNMSSIFNALESNVENPIQLRNKLIQQHSTQSKEITELFNSYGY